MLHLQKDLGHSCRPGLEKHRIAIKLTINAVATTYHYLPPRFFLLHSLLSGSEKETRDDNHGCSFSVRS